MSFTLDNMDQSWGTKPRWPEAKLLLLCFFIPRAVKEWAGPGGLDSRCALPTAAWQAPRVKAPEMKPQDG